MAKIFFRNAPNTIKDAMELEEREFIEKYSDTSATPEIIKSVYNQHRQKAVAEGKEVTFKVIQTDEKVKAISTPIEYSDVEVLDDGLTEEERRELAELEALTENEGEMLQEADPSQFPEVLAISPISYKDLGEGVGEEEISEILAGSVEPKKWSSKEVDELKSQAKSNASNRTSEQVEKNNQMADKYASEEEGKESKKEKIRGRARLANADERDARILELLKQGMKGKDILTTMRTEGFTVHAPQVTLIKQDWLRDEQQSF